MRFGTFKTQTGLTVVITHYFPKLQEYSGYVRLGAKEHESLWNKEGKNLEDPAWDLVLGETNDKQRNA